MQPTAPASAAKSLSERLERFAAAVRELEQNSTISEAQSDLLETILDNFEKRLSDEVAVSPAESPVQPNNEAIPSTPHGDQTQALEDIRRHVDETLASMRLRHQERTHLQALCIERLDSVAERCHVSESRAQDAHVRVKTLQQENDILRKDTSVLVGRIQSLEADLTHRDVALDAMGSAASGLEGFLDETTRHQSPVPVPASTPRRKVIRGRGRFRGEYDVDDLGTHVLPATSTPASEAAELQDGVRAWLKGFRDVEEEARSPGRPVTASSIQANRVSEAENDWGSFEEAT